MAEEKYISKVRISGANFVIRDKDSYALAQAAKTAADAAQNTADNIPVNGVTDDITFKDDNGKMFKLSLVDKKVKLVAVTYNAPSIKINNFTWNGSDDLSWDVDQPSTTIEEKEVTGTITVANGQKPTCNVSTVSISGTSSPYTIGGKAAIPNNQSLTITFTTTGTMADPSTGVTAKPTASKVVSRTTTVTSAYMVNSSADAPSTYIRGGFKFTVGAGQVTPTATEFGNNATVPLSSGSTGGYIYIFTSSAKSFVMSTDKATVDSAKLGGGVTDPTTAKTYSIQKQYYVYRSLNPFAANTDVYVKAIV